MRRTVPSLLALLTLSACSGTSDKPAPEAAPLTVALSEAGCALTGGTSAPAGAVTLDIRNEGTDRFDEVYVVQGKKIEGEKEGVGKGKSGSLTLTLTEGSYALHCPGDATDDPFTVTAGSAAPVADDVAEQKAATVAYAQYVKEQVAEQVTATRVLTDAVRRGDLAAATAAYAGARVNYERIEPVAESFGDLDPAVDARIGDVASIAKWTGYHRLEHAIFQQRSLKGMAAIADGLDADVMRLQTLVATETYDPTDLANGASELLDEVAKSKISGEEESYSHVDLVDFQANVDGARKAFELLEPALEKRDSALATRIEGAFDAVDKGLEPYRTGTGPADFKPYSSVAEDQQRVLAGLVDALAEPLSKVAAELVR